MIMLRVFILILSILSHISAYSWNATGHRLIAQIAYDNLTPKAKVMVNKYNQSLDKRSRFSNFTVAATWLDFIRMKDVHWYDALHYMDIPFSLDGTKLPPVQENNALWGIHEALNGLSSNKSSIKDKALSLRILIHVVGDIHQPLHAVSQISKKHPKGDLGGNLYPLGKNSIGENLHRYWDNGAGILMPQRKKIQIQKKARLLERKWSCTLPNTIQNPEQWIKESNQLAVSKAYKIRRGSKPGRRYQLQAQKIVEKQLVFAGCRLSMVLNNIAASK